MFKQLSTAWPCSNKLGQIIISDPQKYRHRPRSNRSFSVPRQSTRKASKNTQQEITAFVSQLKDGPVKLSRDSLYAGMSVIVQTAAKVSVTLIHKLRFIKNMFP